MKRMDLDLTPTWEGLMPGLIAVLENGTDKGRVLARQELMNLARTVDAINWWASLSRASPGTVFK